MMAFSNWTVVRTWPQHPECTRGDGLSGSHCTLIRRVRRRRQSKRLADPRSHCLLPALRTEKAPRESPYLCLAGSSKTAVRASQRQGSRSHRPGTYPHWNDEILGRWRPRSDVSRSGGESALPSSRGRRPRGSESRLGTDGLSLYGESRRHGGVYGTNRLARGNQDARTRTGGM